MHYTEFKSPKRVSYIDEEGDTINVFNSMELEEAIRLARKNGNLLKLNLIFSENKQVKTKIENNFESLKEMDNDREIENLETKEVKLESGEVRVDRGEEFLSGSEEIYNLNNQQKMGETNQALKMISKKMAEEVSFSSDQIYEKIKQQISSEAPIEYKDQFPILSNSLSVALEKANNLVRENLDEELKSCQNDRSEIFEEMKKLSENTKNNISNFSKETNNKLEQFCINYKDQN